MQQLLPALSAEAKADAACRTDFRPLGAGLLRPGRAWRGGDLSFATDDDQRAIWRAAGLRTFLDLRSNESAFELECLQRPVFGRFASRLNFELAEGLLPGGGAMTGDPRAAEYRRRIESGELGPAAPGGMAEFMLELNKQMLTVHGDRIRAALMEFTRAASFPIMLGCMHGKDRTGLVAALLLGACGFGRAEVMADYTISAQSVEKQLDVEECRFAADTRRQEQGPIDSRDQRRPRSEIHPEILEATLAWLDEEHGGILSYLEGIGIDAEAVAALRAELLPTGRL